MTGQVLVGTADWERDRGPIKQLRHAVFVVEQNVPADVEFDGRDESATHFIACDDTGAVIGTGRLLPDGQIGRMAVAQLHRGRGIGRQILDLAVANARDSGMHRVFLHAQTHAVEFYAAAGFAKDGEPFMEAGIPHLPMAREFPLEFVAQPNLAAPLVRTQSAPTGEPRLADVAAGFTRLASDVELRSTIIDLVSRARRLIRIYSQEFDPLLFDSQQLADAISQFARRHQSTRVQVMIHDSLRIVRDGHRIVELRHRLPSSIEIRKVHQDQYQTHYTYLLIDDEAYLMLPRHFEYAGYCNYSDGARVRRHNVHFDEQWDRALPDPNLRVLSL